MPLPEVLRTNTRRGFEALSYLSPYKYLDIYLAKRDRKISENIRAAFVLKIVGVVRDEIKVGRVTQSDYLNGVCVKIQTDAVMTLLDNSAIRPEEVIFTRFP